MAAPHYAHDEFAEQTYGWKNYYTQHKRMAATHYAHADEFWEQTYDWKIYYTQYITTAAPHHAHAYVSSDFV
jgi:hypothetical protein